MAHDDNATQRLFLGLGIALLVVFLLGLPFGWFRWWSDNSWGDLFGMMVAMMFIGPILIVVFIVLLVVSFTKLGRSSNPPQGPAAMQGWKPVEDPDALEILERRYAAGDITRTEYQQMRRDLGR